jgi:serine/threonine-protein kinase
MWPTRFTLTATTGDLKGEEYVFHGPARCEVGRSPDCDIALPMNLLYRDVSRHHCVFEIDPPAIRVRDLGSLNGTLVNGAKIGQRGAPVARGDSNPEHGVRELHDGDEVQVGGTIFRVHVDVLHLAPLELAGVG